MKTNSKINTQFNQWKKYLDLLHIDYKEEDFFKNYDKIIFTQSSITSLEYCRPRYFMLFNEEEMEKFRLSIKDVMMKKRGSMYDIENVAKKHNITLDEARQIVDKRKSLTRGTLENYIKRHGEEEGRRRFKQSNERSKTTKENYKKRYGNEWEKRWNHYMNTRRSKSLEHYIKKYGEEEGKSQYKQKCAEAFKHQSLSFLVEKYGDEQGREKYKEICRKKGYANTLEWYTSKYGKEEGEAQYKKIGLSKGYHSTLESHIRRYGEIEGIKKYEDRCMRLSSTFRMLEAMYGTEQATLKYKNLSKEEIKNHLPKDALKTPPYYKSKKGCISKTSIAFFEQLEKKLGRNLQYGTKNQEFTIFDEINSKKYFYDCFDALSNTLIEVHGVAFHPKEEDTGWTNPFGVPYEIIATRDKNKKELAISNGFKFIVVWDTEINTKTKTNNKLQQVTKEINENSKNTN